MCFSDVKEAKAPEKKKEEPDEDDGNIPSYNIASSLAETLRNLPKEDLAPPPPQNDRYLVVLEYFGLDLTESCTHHLVLL